MSFNSDKDLFIIAELSANHNNNYDLAVKTIEAIALTGADAVKIQTYRPESLTMNVENDFFPKSKNPLWAEYRPYELFSKGTMPYEWQPKLKKIAEGLGLVFFSTPFDHEGVEFLEKMNVPLYKIASSEINDIPLIKKIASKGKPVIISTGMANLGDIEEAVNTCREMDNNDITLLKCTAEYPAKVEDANLLTIPNMKEIFGVRVGVSDHTMGSVVPITSVALGGRVIEKHFILDRSLGGIDSAFSMEPAEFKSMVDNCHAALRSLGEINYELSEEQAKNRRSIFISQDIKAGEELTTENIRSIRPANGLQPKHWDDVIGKKARRHLTRGNPLSWGDVELLTLPSTFSHSKVN